MRFGDRRINAAYDATTVQRLNNTVSGSTRNKSKRYGMVFFFYFYRRSVVSPRWQLAVSVSKSVSRRLVFVIQLFRFRILCPDVFGEKFSRESDQRVVRVVPPMQMRGLLTTLRL